MSYFVNNRQLINKLAINTGTAQNPSYVDLCCASERTINFDMDEQDFSVCCDALKRQIVTGASVGLNGTLKLDVNNDGDIALLDKVHTLIGEGEISQFTNVEIEFDLLSGVNAGVLEYTTYRATATLSLSDIGGNAEDEGEMSFELTLIGTATEVTSA